MSDQPKPTGEWTVETVDDLLDYKRRNSKAVADAHNAALAAVKDAHCRDCCCARSWEALGDFVKGAGSIPEHIESLREQLAAERERADRMEKLLRSMSQERVKDYFDLLAAERELAKVGAK